MDLDFNQDNARESVDRDTEHAERERESDEKRDLVDSEETKDEQDEIQEDTTSMEEKLEALEAQSKKIGREESAEEHEAKSSAGDEEVEGLDMVGDENETQPTE